MSRIKPGSFPYRTYIGLGQECEGTCKFMFQHFQSARKSGVFWAKVLVRDSAAISQEVAFIILKEIGFFTLGFIFICCINDLLLLT